MDHYPGTQGFISLSFHHFKLLVYKKGIGYTRLIYGCNQRFWGKSNAPTCLLVIMDDLLYLLHWASFIIMKLHWVRDHSSGGFPNLIYSGLIFHNVLGLEFISLVLANCLPEWHDGPLREDEKSIQCLLEELEGYDAAGAAGLYNPRSRAARHPVTTRRWGDTRADHLIAITSCSQNKLANMDVIQLCVRGKLEHVTLEQVTLFVVASHDIWTVWKRFTIIFPFMAIHPY